MTKCCTPDLLCREPVDQCPWSQHLSPTGSSASQSMAVQSVLW